MRWTVREILDTDSAGVWPAAWDFGRCAVKRPGIKILRNRQGSVERTIAFEVPRQGTETQIWGANRINDWIGLRRSQALTGDLGLDAGWPASRVFQPQWPTEPR